MIKEDRNFVVVNSVCGMGVATTNPEGKHQLTGHGSIKIHTRKLVHCKISPHADQVGIAFVAPFGNSDNKSLQRLEFPPTQTVDVGNIGPALPQPECQIIPKSFPRVPLPLDEPVLSSKSHNPLLNVLYWPLPPIHQQGLPFRNEAGQGSGKGIGVE